MKLHITHQESYSRGELLLRSFFGVIYMIFPQALMMGICGIWSAIINFIAFWSILFTGRYPQSMFEYQVKMQQWSLRFNARVSNLVDGYPSFWPSGTDDLTSLEIPYKESYSRGTILLKMFFGLFMIIPHAFLLFFRLLWGGILSMLAWWAVLFTGRYPESWHRFKVETIRWQTRVGCYFANLIEEYPPFNGREDEQQLQAQAA